MTKKVSVIGLFTAMALLLSCIENMLPFRTGIPGIKLGIANLIIVIAFYFLPFGEVLSISLLRVFFLSVFSGSPFTAVFSLTGAIASFLAMYISPQKFFLSHRNQHHRRRDTQSGTAPDLRSSVKHPRVPVVQSCPASIRHCYRTDKRTDCHKNHPYRKRDEMVNIKT